MGSRHLREHFEFGVAASTIRNHLADLEDMGMLAHPHTSAGRVPTDADVELVGHVLLRFGEPHLDRAVRRFGLVAAIVAGAVLLFSVSFTAAAG